MTSDKDREAFFVPMCAKWYEEHYGRQYFPLGAGECPHLQAFIGGYDANQIIDNHLHRSHGE